jgi:hypothetical protein
MVMAPASTSTGLTNLRTIARSSRSITHRPNDWPWLISSWVNAARSTPTATSFGLRLTWVAQLAVMPLRRLPARLPMTYNPLGMVHSTRRLSLSYSTGSAPGGKGPIGSSDGPAMAGG